MIQTSYLENTKKDINDEIYSKMNNKIHKHKQLSSGFIKDFSYIRFVINLIDSGDYYNDSKNATELEKFICDDFNEIKGLYKNILKLISRDDFKKIEKNTMKITTYFMKIISNKDDIKYILVLLLGIYILKYRFAMFKNKKISDDLSGIVEKERLVRLIKNVSKTIPENRSIQIEIDLAKKISIAF